MLDHTHYVPILKTKEGELRALAGLQSKALLYMSPVLEPVPRSGPQAELFRELADRLAECWPRERPFFVHADALLEEADLESERLFFQQTQERGLQAIPVSVLDVDEATAGLLRAIDERDHRGCCLRIALEEFDTEGFEERCQRWFEATGLHPGRAHLLIDLGTIAALPPRRYAMVLRGILTDLPWVREWTSLIVAGGAFPPDLSEVERQSVTRLPRTEWRIWELLAADKERLPRLPTFGDYAAANRALLEGNVQNLRPSANIRYTTDNDWMVVKGTRYRERPDQYHELAATLREQPEFAGKHFSWGDDYIDRCADRELGPGSLTTWVQVRTSHHLTHVPVQLARKFDV